MRGERVGKESQVGYWSSRGLKTKKAEVERLERLERLEKERSESAEWGGCLHS